MNKGQIKRGRPSKAPGINREQVEKLAALNCTNEEIGAFFDVSGDTIKAHFEKEIIKGRNKGNISIRRKQFDVAMGGNVVMLIWLGKQRLGQREPSLLLNKEDEHQLSGLATVFGQALVSAAGACRTPSNNNEV